MFVDLLKLLWRPGPSKVPSLSTSAILRTLLLQGGSKQIPFQASRTSVANEAPELA